MAAVVAEIQQLSGRPVVELTDTTHVVGEMPGFDSLNAEEAVVMLGERLGVVFDATFNPFVAAEQHSARTFVNAVELVAEWFDAEEKRR